MAEELTIQSMTIDDILRKDAFRRAKPLPLEMGEWGGSPDYNANLVRATLKYDYLSQDDFLREYDVHAHAINSIKHYPNFLSIDSEGKIQAKVRSRVAVAWQKRIHTKRVVALTGYDPDISIAKSKSNEKTQADLAAFKEGWAKKGMDTLVHLAVSDDLKVGDVAVCGYLKEGVFGTRIFSYDRGDILYPHFDEVTGELKLFARRFVRDIVDKDGNIEHITYVEVWDDKQYMQCRQMMPSENKLGNDVWKVTIEPRSHGFMKCPIRYHRYGEPCWAASQSLIDQHELVMSQLAENNAQYALRILYTLGAEFEFEGTTDGTPKLISSTDPNAKAGFLENASKADSYELEIKSLEREIMRCSFAVESPELKSGSDLSSLTVKALMADSYLKAVDDAKVYQSWLDGVVELFIEGYGLEARKMADFENLGIQIRLQPWVFLSESEVVNTLVQLVSVGILSKQSATEYAYETLGIGAVDEMKRLLQEEHDELVGQTDGLERQTNNPVNNARKLQAQLSE